MSEGWQRQMREAEARIEELEAALREIEKIEVPRMTAPWANIARRALGDNDD